jgi:hypothetical protein
MVMEKQNIREVGTEFCNVIHVNLMLKNYTLNVHKNPRLFLHRNSEYMEEHWDFKKY